MMKKLAATLVVFTILAAVVLWFLSAPSNLARAAIAQMEAGNPIAGATIFWAGGCASCHAVKGAKGEEKLKLGGGHRLVTLVGTFVTPNISPDKNTGIGDWSGADFANAMLNGISPSGSHYFPSFPYTSYTRMEVGDIADLWAYMKTLPKIDRQNEPHELSILFKIRRGVGLWKRLFMSPDPVIMVDESNVQLARGRYLVEGPGHCAECHTPRGFFGLGGTDKSAWLAGGPAPEGTGKIPNITPASRDIGGWSAGDIAEYLATGFTPDFDTVGGSMVSVQENIAKLSPDDRAAIAAYLKAVPAIDSK